MRRCGGDREPGENKVDGRQLSVVGLSGDNGRLGRPFRSGVPFRIFFVSFCHFVGTGGGGAGSFGGVVDMPKES